MIIKRIEMISFGKFRDKALDFSEGVNVIYGNNESGKSTITDFIYAMFYGFGDKRGKAMSLREKYAPWNGGDCEGKLTLITDDNRKICIYRKAANVKKYDILHVFDGDTGEEIHISPEEIIGINGYTFLKTLCIKQLSSVFEGESDEITQKLSNIATTGDENSDYEKAQKILDIIRREIQPQRGNGGELSAILHKISVCEKNKSIQEDISRELLSVKKQIIVAEEEVKSALAEYDKFRQSSVLNPEKRLKAPSKFSKSALPAFICSMFSFIISILTAFKGNNFSYFFLFSGILLGILGLLNKGHTVQAEKEKYEEKAEKLKENINSARSKLSNLKGVEKSLTVAISEEEDISELYRKKEILERKLKTVTLVSEALRKAYSNMQKNFTPTLNRMASAYFNTITDGKYSGLYCDENFRVKIYDTLPRESSFFSGGTVDQLYLSVRLALADMLFKESRYILLLDQPFLQYDEERKARTLNLLSGLGKCRQVLIFTSDKNLISFNNTTQILT